MIGVSDRLGASRWVHLPEGLKSYKERALCFKMLSKAGCVVEELLHSKASRCPVLLFKLLVDDGVAGQLQKLSKCMLYLVTAAFLTRHPGEQLLGVQATMELQTLAMSLHTETVSVERDHSGFRMGH